MVAQLSNEMAGSRTSQQSCPVLEQDKVLDQDGTHILVSGLAIVVHVCILNAIPFKSWHIYNTRCMGDKGFIGLEINRTQVTKIALYYFVIPAPKQLVNPLDGKLCVQ